MLPPIAVAAALVGDRALGRLANFPYRTPVYAALALYLAAHVSIMAMLHPDQYVYYNAFVGGVPGAENRFKLDYWANSFAEAVRGLEDRLRAQYGAGFANRKFTIAVQGPVVSARYYFPPNFQSVIYPKDADFVIGFTVQETYHNVTDRPIVAESAGWGRLLSVGSSDLSPKALAEQRRLAKHPLVGAALPPSPGAVQRLPAPE